LTFIQKIPTSASCINDLLAIYFPMELSFDTACFKKFGFKL